MTQVLQYTLAMDTADREGARERERERGVCIEQQ